MHRNHLATVFPISASLACAIWLFCWKTRPEREQGLSLAVFSATWHQLLLPCVPCLDSGSRAFLHSDTLTACSGLCSLSFSSPERLWWRKEERAMDRKARRISSLSLFFFSNKLFHPLAAVSTDPKPNQYILLLHSFLTLCSRAHSPSLCPQAERWQRPAFHGPLNLDTAHAGTLWRQIPTVRVREGVGHGLLVNPHSLLFKTLNNPSSQGQATHSLHSFSLRP